MDLPEPREFGWPPKPLDSAETSITHLPNGQIEVIIEHDLVRGITVEMLQWWFSSFTDLTVEKNGRTYPAYLIWHPEDHVGATADKASPDGPMQAGDKITINEVFQRNPKHTVNNTAVVPVLSQEAMGLRLSKLGHPVMDLRHSFRQEEAGVRYHSRMVLGADKGLLKPLINRLAVPNIFSEEKATAWLTHNVEEVGYFEYFLADLFDRREQGATIALP